MGKKQDKIIGVGVFGGLGDACRDGEKGLYVRGTGQKKIVAHMNAVNETPRPKGRGILRLRFVISE